MVSTRSSARLAGRSSCPSSQNNSSPKSAAGTKRKLDTPSLLKPKRGKRGAGKEQKTIEESLPTYVLFHLQNIVFAYKNPREGPNPEPAATDKPITGNSATETADNKAKKTREGAETENIEDSSKERSDITGARPNGNTNGTKTADKTSKMAETRAIEANNEVMTDASQDDSKKSDAPGPQPEESAVEAGAREQETPSSILEKGIIYFFFRARVNVEQPHDTNDIARSFIVLRPVPYGAKIAEGPIGDTGNCRLLVIPKKVLPLSGRDRFLVFVEKAKSSFQELKDNFMPASDHATKAAGIRHTPAATPVGEGIYAITTTGRVSHLAYILTVPSELNEVQKDLGLRERGSFVASIKNPEKKGPPNASFPKGPDYPQE
jgi:hypothetical protein